MKVKKYFVSFGGFGGGFGVLVQQTFVADPGTLAPWHPGDPSTQFRGIRYARPISVKIKR